MPSNGKGIGLASLAIGTIFLYGGLKGYSILKATQNIIQGKPGSTGQNEAVLSDPGNSASSGSSGVAEGNAGPIQGQYDHASLMQLWISVGGSPATANNAACHALQESSGNPNAESPNPDRGTNVGLWQLDTFGVGSGHSIDELKNPRLNAQITVRATHNGQDWSEWATPGC